jgi:hypothetical protein
MNAEAVGASAGRPFPKRQLPFGASVRTRLVCHAPSCKIRGIEDIAKSSFDKRPGRPAEPICWLTAVKNRPYSDDTRLGIARSIS